MPHRLRLLLSLLFAFALVAAACGGDDADSADEATDMTRRLAREEGILAGMSSGGALRAALTVARELESGLVVFIVCDRGDRYLSTGVFGDGRR